MRGIGAIHEELVRQGYAVETVRELRDGTISVHLTGRESPARAKEAQELAVVERAKPARMSLREAELTLLLDPTHVAARALVTREVARLRAERLG